MLATATGLTGLVLAQPGVAPVVSLLAAAYMVYLAYRIATAPPVTNATTEHAPGFGPGLFLGLGNPKAYAAMAALYSGFMLLPSDPVADAVAKTGILLLMIVAVDVVWLLVGSALDPCIPAAGRASRHQRRVRRAVGRLGGAHLRAVIRRLRQAARQQLGACMR